MTCDILKAIKEHLAIPLSSNYDMVTSGRDWLCKILSASSIYFSWSKKLFYPSLLNVLLTFLTPIHNSQLLSDINEATAVPWGFLWGMNQSAWCNIIVLPKLALSLVLDSCTMLMFSSLFACFQTVKAKEIMLAANSTEQDFRLFGFSSIKVIPGSLEPRFNPSNLHW